MRVPVPAGGGGGDASLPECSPISPSSRRLRWSSSRASTSFTGETGAGKTILVEAIDLLVGGRASADLVRTGEAAATVQAIFEGGDRARKSSCAARCRRTGAAPGLHRRRARHDGRRSGRARGRTRRAARAARASDAAQSPHPSAAARRSGPGSDRRGRRRARRVGSGDRGRADARTGGHGRRRAGRAAASSIEFHLGELREGAADGRRGRRRWRRPARCSGTPDG